MIISLLIGAIIGVVLAIPPGPVAVTAIKMGLNKGPREGFLVGLGASVIDFLFCTIAGFATSAALMLIESFAFHHPLATLSLQFLIVSGILVYGFIHLNPKKPFTNSDSVEKVQKSGLLHFLTSKGSFFIGIAISLANMANPTFIPSLTYITLHVQKYGLIENTTSGNFAFAFGFGVGNFLWIYFTWYYCLSG